MVSTEFIWENVRPVLADKFLTNDLLWQSEVLLLLKDSGNIQSAQQFRKIFFLSCTEAVQRLDNANLNFHIVKCTFILSTVYFCMYIFWNEHILNINISRDIFINTLINVKKIPCVELGMCWPLWFIADRNSNVK